MTTKHSRRRKASKAETVTSQDTMGGGTKPVEHHDPSYFTGAAQSTTAKDAPPGPGLGGGDAKPSDPVITITKKELFAMLETAAKIGLWLGKREGQIAGIRATREQALAIIDRQEGRLVRAGHKVSLLRQALYAQQQAGALAMEALDKSA